VITQKSHTHGVIKKTSIKRPQKLMAGAREKGSLEANAVSDIQKKNLEARSSNGGEDEKLKKMLQSSWGGRKKI